MVPVSVRALSRGALAVVRTLEARARFFCRSAWVNGQRLFPPLCAHRRREITPKQRQRSAQTAVSGAGVDVCAGRRTGRLRRLWEVVHSRHDRCVSEFENGAGWTTRLFRARSRFNGVYFLCFPTRTESRSLLVPHSRYTNIHDLQALTGAVFPAVRSLSGGWMPNRCCWATSEVSLCLC